MRQQTCNELRKPVARLMEMSGDEIVRHQKDSWDRARRDEEARNRLSRAEGEATGEARGSAKIALNMLKEGLPVSAIARMTGLTPDEIERLSAQ